MLGFVIAETDQALALVLKRRVIGNAAIAIAFDPPGRPWIQSLKGPAVNLFLFDIKENAHRRDVMYEDVHADGVVVARRPPPPRFDLHYTVSAWAPSVLAEHKILAAALRCFGSITALPREALPPALAALPYDVLVATESGAKRGMFLNFGGELKAGFELTVTVPMPVLPDLPAAPAVQRQPRVNVTPVPGADAARAVPARETVTASPKK
jgi:Pvc16 N-terminal domain